MKQNLTLGYSPCPNDTYIFGALALGLVQAPAQLDLFLADVEELNRRVFERNVDVCKISVAAAAGVLDEYRLLRSGGAMGRGVGPVLVGKTRLDPADLDGEIVAIPGKMTTANLLFGLYCQQCGIDVEVREMVFSEIMPAVARGQVSAGVVIHEGRFTYESLGMARISDLGAWWEAAYGLPIPLGVIAIRRSLGDELAVGMQSAITASLEFARADRNAIMDYVRKHAQEMDEGVIQEHIRMFVTDFSLGFDQEGEDAISVLINEAARIREQELPNVSIFVPRS